jgi:hypothetical protein
MGEILTDLKPVLEPIISRNELFLGNIRHFGFNVCLYFYHFVDQSISLIDVMMFDTAEATLQDDIVNPENLLRVLDVTISDTGPYGRRTAMVRFEELGNATEYEVFFTALACHITSKPVHRIPE